jgi:hypothetical protein
MDASSLQLEKTKTETAGEPLPSSTQTVALVLEENEVVYDEAFVIRKTRWGTLKSFTLDGRAWVVGANSDESRAALIYFTRQHLLREQGLATAHDQLESSYDASPTVDL